MLSWIRQSGVLRVPGSRQSSGIHVPFRWYDRLDSHYEQKTFWSLCNYMVRSCKGIEMLVNLINISYCAMKLLPYVNKGFADYKDKSVREIRFVLNEEIREQIFFTSFVQNIETRIKSTAVINALKQAVSSRSVIYKVVKWCRK